MTRGKPYGLDLFAGCATCAWRQEHFFCNLDPQTLKAFEEMAFTSVYPEGAVPFSEGQTARGAFLICHGSAKLSISSADGKTLITRIAKAGELLGASEALAGHPYSATAETLEPTQLNFVRSESLSRLLDSSAAASRQIIRQLIEECAAGTDHIRAIELARSAAERLAGLIASWCRDEGSEGSCRCQMLMTHEEVAELIGTSRETVTRLLKEFRERKLIAQKGSSLIVPDPSALEAGAVTKRR